MIDIRNPREYCEAFLWILDKKKHLVPLKFNPAQERLYEIIKEEHDAGRPVRLVILKGRQLGTSTQVEGLYFADTVTRENVYTIIIAHEEQATSHLFEMNKIFFDNLPDALKPMRRASNAQELVFENPTKDPVVKKRFPGLRSRIRCVTAGGRVLMAVASAPSTPEAARRCYAAVGQIQCDNLFYRRDIAKFVL